MRCRDSYKSVTVDGVSVHLELPSGNMFCSLSSTTGDEDNPIPPGFLGEDEWRHTSRPDTFIKNPSLLDYMRVAFSLLQVHILLFALPFGSLLSWACPPCVGKRASAVSILARRMTSMFHILPLVPWKVRCLETSLLCNRWARLLGLPAVLLIGIRVTPFTCHAWNELEDVVISDSQTVRSHFSVIWRSNEAVSQ
jgi:Transglutaminase-like superfamily